MGTDLTGKPWHTRPGESSKAFAAFCEYLQMPKVSRSIRAVQEKLGRPEGYQRQLQKWSSRFDWLARAKAYDTDHLAEEIDGRKLKQELLRQKIYDVGEELIDSFLAMCRGELPEGDTVPMFDRHQNEIGTKPAVPTSTRARLIIRGMELLNLTVPKRIELTGDDGNAIRLQARSALSSLKPEQLAELAKAFGVKED